MKKTKRYYNVLFIADVIKEAVNSLLSAADVKEIDWRTNAMTINFPSESWDYDNEEEFYADYREKARGRKKLGDVVSYVTYSADDNPRYSIHRYATFSLSIIMQRRKQRPLVLVYKWSSAYAHVLKKEDSLLSKDCPLIEAIEDWNLYLSQTDDDEWMERFRVLSRTGRPAGGEYFITMIESLLGRVVKPKQSGRPRKLKSKK